MLKIEIDKEDFIFFIKLGCSNKELAEVFGCSERTIAKRKVEWNLLGLTENNKTSDIVDNKRVCLKCKKQKHLKYFTKHSSAKSGYRSTCRTCRSEESKSWYKENKEQKALTNKKHYEANKEIYFLKDSKRRAKLKKAIPSWYSESDDLEFLKLKTKCKELHKKTGIMHEIDHIIPLQSAIVCGLHCKENWQILTREQNRSKSNKHIT